MSRQDQLTMAMVHEAFLLYLKGRNLSTDSEWQHFKSLLLTRMQTESAARSTKEHG